MSLYYNFKKERRQTMNKSNYVTLSRTLVKDVIKNDLIKEGKLGPDFVPDNLLPLVNKNS